jgi:regulator of sirC expression with transglutaminase-like and TPR domain
MNASFIAEKEPTLPESQRQALLTLLDDEDPVVYETVRQKIISCGEGALNWLQPHLSSRKPLFRRRVQEIVEHLARQTADTRFLSFCVSQGEDLDAEQGVWLLAQTRYPDTHAVAYQAVLDSYADDLRNRINPGAPARQTLETLNQYLFEELGFRGNEVDYYHPDNSYLNRVMDFRTGNPVSLCLVYLFLGWRLRLPLSGIGLPGHFLCRFQSSLSEIYVDAFNHGRLLTRADCVRYLVQTSQGLQDGFLTPMRPRRILLRICSNLHQVYLQRKEAREAERLKRYVVALAK